MIWQNTDRNMIKFEEEIRHCDIISLKFFTWKYLLENEQGMSGKKHKWKEFEMERICFANNFWTIEVSLTVFEHNMFC